MFVRKMGWMVLEEQMGVVVVRENLRKRFERLALLEKRLGCHWKLLVRKEEGVEAALLIVAEVVSEQKWRAGEEEQMVELERKTEEAEEERLE